jgi:hypothetical protein
LSINLIEEEKHDETLTKKPLPRAV